MEFSLKLSVFICLFYNVISSETCNTPKLSENDEKDTECNLEDDDYNENYMDLYAPNNYLHETVTDWEEYKSNIKYATENYVGCSNNATKCSCHYDLIKKDLMSFASGIQKSDIEKGRDSGVLYQVINHRLYRDNDCMFPSRCSGVEYFILKIIDKLPDVEFIINTRDWPQAPTQYDSKFPIFSFSKIPKEYYDITYPAWTFWEGGPAISMYPTGLGRWDLHRKSLTKAAEEWPWHKKHDIAFFRGSRTSSERDPVIYLSREDPSLVDAKYTKNQAWKSEEDTLYAPPAPEVSLEDHCSFKYLFNLRGVSASFRLKHLFMCGSLVLHADEDWLEFFYPQLKPWVHYVPVPSHATKEQLRNLVLFVKKNDQLASEIATRGAEFVRAHLRMKDVLCYWRKLLVSYAGLLKYSVTQREGLRRIVKRY